MKRIDEAIAEKTRQPIRVPGFNDWDLGAKLFPKAEAKEIIDGDGVTEFLALGLEESLNGGIGVLHEALLKKAALGVEFAKLTLDDLLKDVSRLTSSFHLLAEDVLLGLNKLGRNVFTLETCR